MITQDALKQYDTIEVIRTYRERDNKITERVMIDKKGNEHITELKRDIDYHANYAIYNFSNRGSYKG